VKRTAVIPPRQPTRRTKELRPGCYVRRV
jgi:hypothetical protein